MIAIIYYSNKQYKLFSCQHRMVSRDLIIACAVGDLDWVRLCVAKGAAPGSRNEQVHTLYACTSHNTLILVILYATWVRDENLYL